MVYVCGKNNVAACVLFVPVSVKVHICVCGVYLCIHMYLFLYIHVCVCVESPHVSHSILVPFQVSQLQDRVQRGERGHRQHEGQTKRSQPEKLLG